MNKWQIKRLKGLAIALFCAFLLYSSPAIAAPTTAGAQLFEVHCAGCHANGGNIIRRGKNLKQKALQRNGVDTLAAVTEIVTNGKNNMSAFRDRLSAEEIEIVSAYVLDRATENWKN